MEQKAIQDQWSEVASHCWGCGRNNEHGLQIKSYWEGDETVCRWHPKEYHTAYPGMVCGGIIATIMDCHCLNTVVSVAYRAEGRAMDTKPDIVYVTGSLLLKLLRPTPIDKPIVLRARIKEKKERVLTRSPYL